MRSRRSDWRQVERVCGSCGAVFTLRPAVVKPVNYCSRACSAAAIRGKPTPAGEAHPRWRGDSATRQAGRMRAWTWFPAAPCQVCGADPNRTRVERHHIDGNTLNNEPSNIAFLCQKHHAAQHPRRRKEIAP